jgi:hypothetical protein
MAAGVLATLPMAAGVPDTEGLPIAVFACVLTTIAIFAIGFPLTKRRLAPSEGFGVVPLPAGAARPTIPPGPVIEGGGAAGLAPEPGTTDPGATRQ